MWLWAVFSTAICLTFHFYVVSLLFSLSHSPCRFENIIAQTCTLLACNSCRVYLNEAISLDRNLLGKWRELHIKAQHGKFGASSTNSFGASIPWAHARDWTLAVTGSKQSNISCQLNKSEVFFFGECWNILTFLKWLYFHLHPPRIFTATSLLQLGIKQISLFPWETFLPHFSICKFFSLKYKTHFYLNRSKHLTFKLLVVWMICEQIPGNQKKAHPVLFMCIYIHINLSIYLCVFIYTSITTI